MIWPDLVLTLYSHLVFLELRLQVRVQEGQLVFLVGEIHEGLEQVDQHALVALVAEERLENPVVGCG